MVGSYSDKAKDVGRFFGVNEQQVYRLVRERRLPPDTFIYLNKRTLRFSLEKLRQWAESEKQAA